MNSWWYFIPFILVPVLVHLFDFRRTKKLYFSSVKYLSNLTSKTRSKSRLRYFLILSNRILLFLCLIGLLAILIGRSNYADQEGLVAVYYDNSLSATLNDSDDKVQLGLRQLAQNKASILFMSNSEKYLIDNDSDFSIAQDKSTTSHGLDVLSSMFDDIDVKSHFIFSDFQSKELSKLRDVFSDTTRNYHLILTNDLNSVSNVIVDSLYLVPNQENFSELSIHVDFEVLNMSDGNVVVKLITEGRQLSSIVKDVTELDGVRFDVSKDLEGEFEVLVDGDNVLFDNVFHFTLKKRYKPKIVIINSNVSRVLDEVFNNSDLFEVSYQEINSLDYEDLSVADLVVISDQYVLPHSLPKQLDKTSFLVFAADSVDVNSYRDFLDLDFEFLNEARSEINIDRSNPLLRGIFDRSYKAGTMPTELMKFQINGDFEPIISFRGGIPFLLKKDEIYFFNSPIAADNTGFQANALFLPILYQIAFSTTGSIETPYYYPGGRITVSSKVSDVPVKLVNDGYEVIPRFNATGSQTTLELPNDLNAGKYGLIQGQDTLKRIAINSPKSESIMRAPSLNEIDSVFSETSNVTVSPYASDESVVSLVSSSQSSLWKYALILALLLILTETVLHRYLK